MAEERRNGGGAKEEQRRSGRGAGEKRRRSKGGAEKERSLQLVKVPQTNVKIERLLIDRLDVKKIRVTKNCKE